MDAAGEDDDFGDFTGAGADEAEAQAQAKSVSSSGGDNGSSKNKRTQDELQPDDDNSRAEGEEEVNLSREFDALGISSPKHDGAQGAIGKDNAVKEEETTRHNDDVNLDFLAPSSSFATTSVASSNLSASTVQLQPRRSDLSDVAAPPAPLPPLRPADSDRDFGDFDPNRSTEGIVDVAMRFSRDSPAFRIGCAARVTHLEQRAARLHGVEKAVKLFLERAALLSQAQIALTEALDRCDDAQDDEGDGSVALLASSLRSEAQARDFTLQTTTSAFARIVERDHIVTEAYQSTMRAKDAYESALARYASAPSPKEELALIHAKERYELWRFDLVSLLQQQKLQSAVVLTEACTATCKAIAEGASIAARATKANEDTLPQCDRLAAERRAYADRQRTSRGEFRTKLANALSSGQTPDVLLPTLNNNNQAAPSMFRGRTSSAEPPPNEASPVPPSPVLPNTTTTTAPPSSKPPPAAVQVSNAMGFGWNKLVGKVSEAANKMKKQLEEQIEDAPKKTSAEQKLGQIASDPLLLNCFSKFCHGAGCTDQLQEYLASADKNASPSGAFLVKNVLGNFIQSEEYQTLVQMMEAEQIQPGAAAAGAASATSMLTGSGSGGILSNPSSQRPLQPHEKYFRPLKDINEETAALYEYDESFERVLEFARASKLPLVLGAHKSSSSAGNNLMNRIAAVGGSGVSASALVSDLSENDLIANQHGNVVKSGFLRKRVDGLIQSWKRQWYVLTKDAVFVVTLGSSGASGSATSSSSSAADAGAGEDALIGRLALLTCRPVANDKFAFELLSPLHAQSYYLQAESPVDRDSWVEAIRITAEQELLREGTSMNLKSTAATTAVAAPMAAGATGVSAVSSAALISPCADCGAPVADWVSVNCGVFICLECSGVHRSMGTHVSRIQSIRLDVLPPLRRALLSNLGNERVNSLFEAKLGGGAAGTTKKPQLASRQDRERFITDKYVKLAYAREKTAADEDLLGAARAGDALQCLACIILGGKDVNAEFDSGSGDSALHLAARGDFVPCYALLLERGANVSVQNRSGETAVQVAGQELRQLL